MWKLQYVSETLNSQMKENHVSINLDQDFDFWS